MAVIVKGVGFGFVGVLLAHQPASAADFTLQAMNRKVWAVAQGAPAAIDTITQTHDGTLWLGSAVGLFHFDGMKFESYPAPADPPLPSPNISTLAVAPDGALWIGFRFGGVSSLRDGHLTNYGAREGVPEGTVKSLVWDLEGSLWVASTGGLARFSHQHWERLARAELPATFGAVVDHTGTLWAATEDRVYAKADHADTFRMVAPRGELRGGSPPFAVSPDGAVWARTDSGLRSLTAPSGPQQKSRVLPIQGYSPLLFDRDGNLWLGGGGTLHLIAPDEEVIPAISSHTDAMADALVASGVQSLFQDREGNIWIGASSGIARFNKTNVLPVSLPDCTDWGYGLAADAAGVLWISCSDPSLRRGITEVRGGAVVGRPDHPTFTAAYRDSDGSLWFGSRSGIVHLSGEGKTDIMPLPPGTAAFEAQALARDRAGALWFSVVRKGVYRWADGEWSLNGGLDNLPRGPAIVISTDAAGTLWFGYPGNRIARVEGREVRLLGRREGLDVGNVTAIAIRGEHLWVSGDLGLSRYDGGRFHRVIDASGKSFSGITGILETRRGDAWFNSGAGIVHFSPAEVDALWHQPDYRVRAALLNYLDGIPGIAQEVRPIPSAVETSDGRLWFATQGGVVQIDVNRSIHNLLPPPVTIWSLYADEVRYPVNGAVITLPTHTANIRLDFTAGSLTLPERVAFRYRLEGFDPDWKDSGGRRQAFYTNLPPGQYTFRAIASNNDGVWNETGGAARFTILPAFYQRGSFYALMTLLGLALLTLLYRLRTRQISIQVRSRLEERLAERERIARELHDTLLQGVQGLILRFQAATDILPEAEPAKKVMDSTLERADELLGQSRARVKDLRDPAWQLVPLPEALAAEGEERSYPAQFRVSTEGTARELHPIVREEAFLIGREALANVFHHAAATRIEVEVHYGQAGLRLRVRDDGRGIDSATLRGEGTNDHWGLLGMHERARRLSGRLEIWSTLKAGTEIELRVPAAVAYSEPWRPLRRPWWRRQAKNFFQEPS